MLLRMTLIHTLRIVNDTFSCKYQVTHLCSCAKSHWDEGHSHPPAVPLSCTSWYKSSTPQRMDPYVCVDKRESKTCLNHFFVSSEKFLVALTSWGMVMVWYQLHKNSVTFTLKNDFKFWSHAWKSPSSFTVLVHYQPRLQISNAMTPEK